MKTVKKYDKWARVTGEMTIAQSDTLATVTYGYDELGRLQFKRIQTPGLDNWVWHDYNVRDWLVRTKDNQVENKYYYESPTRNAGTGQWGGNLSAWKWKNGVDSLETCYAYDGLSRLSSYHEFFTDGQQTPHNSREYIYDKNSNILTESRMGMSTGSVQYALNGNQLAQVGGSPAFAYDSMGRMTFDGHNSLTLEYNILDRIKKVKQDTTVLANYSYLADGRKESALNGSGNGLLYVGSLIYRKTGSEVVPESAIWSEGRLIAEQDAWGSWTWIPLVHSTDRLGSVMVVRNGVTGEILERSSYSAYGDRIVLGAQGPGTTNRFHYNGKEDQSFVGVPYSDYGARMYDPSVRRWITCDPLRADVYHFSPYIMCSNNAINRIDYNGEWDITVHVYNNRSEYGYGIAIVKNRSGEEVFRFLVRAQGITGRNRMIEGSDTPLGIYSISKQQPWISGKSRNSYGPYPRLNLQGISGEIIETGRDEIRIHGGRQERLINGKWVQEKHPKLKMTMGCLRCYDADIHSLKELTDNITAVDDQDLPGNVTVVDDLVKELIPRSTQNMIEVQEQYVVPENSVAERFLGKLWQKDM